MKEISGARCCANADPARSIITANRCLFTVSSLPDGDHRRYAVRHVMRTRFQRRRNGLIAPRHHWYRWLAFTVIAVAIAYPTRAARAVDEAADLARLSLEVQRA